MGKKWSLNRCWVLGVLSVLLLTASVCHAAVRELDTQGVQKLLRDEPGQVFLLDVRTAGEFAGGRMPGAVLIPMDQISRRIGEIPKNRKVLVVCASGARSAAVARYLDQGGFPWVANYTGGVSQWARRGLPLEQ